MILYEKKNSHRCNFKTNKNVQWFCIKLVKQCTSSNFQHIQRLKHKI